MFESEAGVRTAADDVAAALAFARSRAARSTLAEDIAVRWALSHPLAAHLAGARPGPALATTLADLAVADAPSEDLLEAVGAWERVSAWAAAQQASVLQELHRRVEGSTWAQKGLRQEVAGTLAVSGRAAQVVLERAVELAEAPEVHDALNDGVLSVRKADVLLRDTGSLSSTDARRVHEHVLPDAHLMTTPQLSAAARLAALELDPGAAEVRHEQARRERCVVLEPAGDCMATIRAYLPAVDAARAMRALDAVAATAAPEDPRGIDARRADALVDVLATVLERGVAPDGQRLHPRKGRAPRLSITISTDALAGISGTPAVLEGYGPILPGLARQIAREAAWHFRRTDAVTGESLELPGSRYRPPDSLRDAVVARDVTCTFPGCRTSAEVCDLDHTVPFDDTRDPGSQTRKGNLAALYRHHHRIKTHGGWTPRRDPATGVTVWTSPTGKPYTRGPMRAPGGADARSVAPQVGPSPPRQGPNGSQPELARSRQEPDGQEPSRRRRGAQRPREQRKPSEESQAPDPPPF